MPKYTKKSAKSTKSTKGTKSNKSNKSIQKNNLIKELSAINNNLKNEAIKKLSLTHLRYRKYYNTKKVANLNWSTIGRKYVDYIPLCKEIEDAKRSENRHTVAKKKLYKDLSTLIPFYIRKDDFQSFDKKRKEEFLFNFFKMVIKFDPSESNQNQT